MRVAAAALSAALLYAAAIPFFAASLGGTVYAESVSEECGVGRVAISGKPTEETTAAEDQSADRLFYIRPAHEIGCTDYEAEIEAIARTMWGEARGVPSKTEIAAVGWCILNRVDSPDFPDTVLEVCAQPKQFQGYSPVYPVTDYLRELAADVLTRWLRENEGEEDVGRVLPSEYLYFFGDGTRNYFTTEFLGAEVYGWELPSPYED